MDDTELGHLRRRLQELDAENTENAARRAEAEAAVARLQDELKDSRSAKGVCDACVSLLDVMVADRIIATLRRLHAEAPGALAALLDTRVKVEDNEASPLALLNEIAGRHPDGLGRIHAIYSVLCEHHDPEQHDALEKYKGLVVGDPCPWKGCDGKIILGDLLGFEHRRFA